jgi:hypothetical protein
MTRIAGRAQGYICTTVYVFPKPEEPKKDKKLTKREAGISHKMEMVEIRLRFGQYTGATCSDEQNQD